MVDDNAEVTCFLINESRRRQAVARYIYDLWTAGSDNLAGLAAMFLDGRIDSLGSYVTMSLHEDEGIAGAGTPTTIDKIHCDDLSYDDFVTHYMQPNRPVIILGLTTDWRANRDMIHEVDGCSVPNIEFMRQNFGNDKVSVYEQQSSGFGLNRPVLREMSVAQYVDWWQIQQKSLRQEGPLLYLKDWKFVVAHPEYDGYKWPVYFQDDWLNQALNSTYKFFYVGPAGSSTQLHVDVLQSFSWSTNVCGHKRWYLVPPKYTYLLYDCFGRNLAPHLQADQEGRSALYPGLPLARRHAICVEQAAGETLFVPSQWYHTVENTQDTFSINHNWLNGFNIRHAWEHVQAQVDVLRHQYNHSRSITLTDTQADQACKDISCSQNSNDLILFWEIISARAVQIFSQTVNKNQNNGYDHNVRALQQILLEMLNLVSDSRSRELTKGPGCSAIKELTQKFERFVISEST